MNAVTKSGQWKEGAEHLAQMQENLTATREALKTKKYRQARPEMYKPLLAEAENRLKTAAGILERNPTLSGGDSYVAFDMCILVALRNMQLALRDPAVSIGTKAWEKAVKGGEIRAEIRYRDKQILAELYRRFAPLQDAMGLARPSDIYDDFVERCEAEEIDAPKAGTFRTRLASTRKELKLA